MPDAAPHLPAARWPAYRFSMVVLVLVVLSSACSGEYSSDGATALTPSELTQIQRLKQINTIGQRPYLETRWRYRLMESCELKVTKGRLFSKETQVLHLTQAQLIRRFDRTDRTHDVHLENDDAVVPLLESASWADSVRFYTLIDAVKRDCDPEASA